MNLSSSLIHLQAWLQAETTGQRRLLEVLERLEASAVLNAGDELLAAGGELEDTLQAGIGRDVRRGDLMAGFAREFGVPAPTLSVASVLERARTAGENVDKLTEMRTELCTAAEDVTRQAKRLSVLATHHRSVLHELLLILGTSSANEEASRAGVLVDAEG